MYIFACTYVHIINFLVQQFVISFAQSDIHIGIYLWPLGESHRFYFLLSCYKMFSNVKSY